MRTIEEYAIDGFWCQIREHKQGDKYTIKLTVYSPGPEYGESLVLPQWYETPGGARGGLLGYLDRGNALYHDLKHTKKKRTRAKGKKK